MDANDGPSPDHSIENGITMSLANGMYRVAMEDTEAQGWCKVKVVIICPADNKTFIIEGTKNADASTAVTQAGPFVDPATAETGLGGPDPSNFDARSHPARFDPAQPFDPNDVFPTTAVSREDSPAGPSSASVIHPLPSVKAPPHIRSLFGAPSKPSPQAQSATETASTPLPVPQDDTFEADPSVGAVVYNKAAEDQLKAARWEEWEKNHWQATAREGAAAKFIHEWTTQGGLQTSLVLQLDTPALRFLTSRDGDVFNYLSANIACFSFLDLDVCGMYYPQFDASSGKKKLITCDDVDGFTHVFVDGLAKSDLPMNDSQTLSAVLSTMSMTAAVWVEFKDCLHLTTYDLRFVIEALPKLEGITISGCPRIRPDHVIDPEFLALLNHSVVKQEFVGSNHPDSSLHFCKTLRYLHRNCTIEVHYDPTAVFDTPSEHQMKPGSTYKKGPAFIGFVLRGLARAKYFGE